MSGECDKCGEYASEKNYDRWKEEVLNYMAETGWKFDRDDETTLGFYKYDVDGNKWFKDFSKETRRFVQFNGDQKVNIVVSKVRSESVTK